MQSNLLRVILISAVLVFSCTREETNSEKESKTPVTIDKEEPKESPLASKANPEPPKKQRVEVATFVAPEMGESQIKSLVGALTDQNGVTEAKPDSQGKSLAVTFEAGETNPKEILEVLVKVVPDISLDKVEAAVPGEGPKHDCGGCPMRNSCGGNH